MAEDTTKAGKGTPPPQKQKEATTTAAAPHTVSDYFTSSLTLAFLPTLSLR